MMTAIDQTDNFTDHLLITIIKPNTEKIPDQNKETTIEQWMAKWGRVILVTTAMRPEAVTDKVNCVAEVQVMVREKDLPEFLVSKKNNFFLSKNQKQKSKLLKI